MTRNFEAKAGSGCFACVFFAIIAGLLGMAIGLLTLDWQQAIGVSILSFIVGGSVGTLIGYKFG